MTRNTILSQMLLIFICGSFVQGQAQMHWTDISAQYAPLPSSVQVFKSTDSVEGKPSICYYVVADLKDKNLTFTTQTGKGKRFTPQQYYEREGKPLLVMNGTFFSFADNRNLNVVIRDGEMLAYNIPSVKGKNDSLYRYITRGALGISKSRKADVAWLYTDTTSKYPLAFQTKPSTLSGAVPNPSNRFFIKKSDKSSGLQRKWKVQTAIGGGPVLLQQGEVRVTTTEERMFVNGENDRHPRTSMGYTADGKLIILMAEGRNPGIAEGLTLTQQAEIFKQLGCVEALNLDGGGSSCLLLNGIPTIKVSDKEGQRPVPAVFIIYSN